MLLMVFSAHGGCGSGPDQEARPVAPRIPKVKTITLEPEAWTQSIRTYGVIEPAEEVDITIDFSATVRSVTFKEGQRIEAGATLMEFDARKRSLRLQQAESVVSDARAGLNRARGKLQRRRALFENRNIGVEEYRLSMADFDSAKARFEQALAARKLAERELGETTLSSPVGGVVARRAVEPGQTVMPGTQLATIQTVDTVRAVAHVTEKDVNALRVGAEAEVTTPGVRGVLYPARIESIGAKADPRTGNFAVKLTVANNDGLLRDGMTARVEIEGVSISDTLLVPRRALVDRRLHRVVYTVVEGRAVEVEPVFAATIGDRLPVLDGLDAGDRLIVDGLESVIDGTRVEVGKALQGDEA